MKKKHQLTEEEWEGLKLDIKTLFTFAGEQNKLHERIIKLEEQIGKVEPNTPP